MWSLLKKDRFLLILMVGLPLLGLLSCRHSIDPEASIRFDVAVQVVDSSYITRTIFGQEAVPGARVTLQDIRTRTRYSAKTGPNGVAVIKNLLPEIYNCEIQREYPADTVLQYLSLDQSLYLTGSLSSLEITSPADSFSVNVKAVSSVPFLISEIFYNGSPPPPPLYFHDQFTEIYNNSTDTMYLDSYAIADIDYGYRDDPDYVYCIHLYKFPGNGQDYPVAPGEAVVIAQDAEDHTIKNANSLNLSGADFEYYNHLSSDIDNPFVPNMIQIHHKYGFDFLYSVMNDAIVLLHFSEEDTLEYGPFNLLKVPKNWVVDGVEYKEDIGNLEYKRLSDDIDAGLCGGMPAYQGKSVARKVFKTVNGQKILMDHNNSFIDFETMNTPTPGEIQ
ncbi:MAG: DUF4876 domain-containing protein [Calditrichia bacterium]